MHKQMHMKKLLLAGMAVSLLGGPAWAQGPLGNGPDTKIEHKEKAGVRGNSGHERGTPDIDRGAPEVRPTGPEVKGPEREERGNLHVQQHTTVQGRGNGGTHTRIATPTETLSGEQKVRIDRTIIQSSSAPRVENVDFDIQVGAPVPRTVEVVPVTEEFVEVFPEWQGFDFFVTGDDIVVVDPNTFAVAGVVEG